MTKITNDQVINLVILRDFLKAELPEDRFNLDSFRTSKEGLDVSRKEELTTCGAVGCAVGWSGEIFGYEKSDFRYSSFDSCDVIEWYNLSDRLFGVLENSRLLIDSYFEEDMNDWDYLFCPNREEKMSKKATIKRIEQFIKVYYKMEVK